MRIAFVMLCAASLFLTGCSGGCEKAKSVVGVGEKPTPTPEDPEVAKQRAIDEKKQKEEEKRQKELQAIEEKKLKEQQLKDGDALVHKWAEQLATNANDGFPRQEGLIELDPWGNPLRIDYRQEWFSEIAVVRSAGPDGKYDTVDDLTRTRKASNPAGVFRGLGFWGWLILIWISTGLLAFLFSFGIRNNRRHRGKNPHHKNVIAFALLTILLAPLVVIIYGIQYVGGALGAAGDFFDGFEFDFFD